MYVAKKNVALTIPFPFPMYLVSKTQHRQLVLFVVRIIFSNHPDTFSTWIIRIRGSDIVANFNVSCQIPNTWLYRQNIHVCMFQMKNDLLTMKNKEKEKLSRGSQWGSSLDLSTARNFNSSSKKARETLTVKISACQNLSFRECHYYWLLRSTFLVVWLPVPISALKHTYQLRSMAITLRMRTTYHPGSGSRGQLCRPYWGSSAWRSRQVYKRANPRIKDPLALF